MTARAFLPLLFLLCTVTAGHAQRRDLLHSAVGKVLFVDEGNGHYTWRLGNGKAQGDNVRLVAIGLDVALGLFGVHRMYLGTDVKVPVFYTLTIGGGGVLWLVDLGLLVFSKDIEPYRDNPHLFMWIPADE